MSGLDFLEAVEKLFKSNGWDADLKYGIVPSLNLDLWRVFANAAKIRALVKGLANDNGVDHRHVLFRVKSGRLLIQFCKDLIPSHSLAGKG